ncbi:hypothetical protein EVAR_40051_1 [Eumeta japonica]|uniref:Secreted protein n=1 Tax=Eumeta variegata TaxID=151549 RepID=A0A4C1WBY8_EUMVA|nr:hypothetical protein EVAR_40051_1 [Eumeta japonica]
MLVRIGICARACVFIVLGVVRARACVSEKKGSRAPTTNWMSRRGTSRTMGLTTLSSRGSRSQLAPVRTSWSSR